MGNREVDMAAADLPQPKQGKTKGLHWIKRAAALGPKPRKFSVPEGKRVLKMLEGQGLKASALEVAPDGGFRFEVKKMQDHGDVDPVNTWDEVL